MAMIRLGIRMRLGPALGCGEDYRQAREVPTCESFSKSTPHLTRGTSLIELAVVSTKPCKVARLVGQRERSEYNARCEGSVCHKDGTAYHLRPWSQVRYDESTNHKISLLWQDFLATCTWAPPTVRTAISAGPTLAFYYCFNRAPKS